MQNTTNSKITANNLDELRQQIDYLEKQIRQAEQAAMLKLEESAPLQSIYKWKAPERIHVKRSKNWYITVSFFIVIIVAYSALTQNYLLILALIMLLILLYALDTFPPKEIEHEILNKGIKTMDKIYTWNKIESFWVTKRNDQYVLNFDLYDERIPRMILLVGNGNINKIVRELVFRIDYKNPGGTQQDILTRLTEGKHMPLTKFLDVFKESKKLNIKPQSAKEINEPVRTNS